MTSFLFIKEHPDHSDFVTSLSFSSTEKKGNRLVSSSRDKTLIVWDYDNLNNQLKKIKTLKGHKDVVSDCKISKNGEIVVSSSWDKTIRYWDLEKNSSKEFKGHDKEVMSIELFFEKEFILSGQIDGYIYKWNTKGEILKKIKPHNGCVSSINCQDKENCCSVSWDRKLIYIDPINLKFEYSKVNDKSFYNTCCVSPDGSLVSIGGNEGKVKLFDYCMQEFLCELDLGDVIINDLVYSPNRYWVCAATNKGIKIYDLETKEKKIKIDEKDCFCLCWSSDGNQLFVGKKNGIKHYHLSE